MKTQQKQNMAKMTCRTHVCHWLKQLDYACWHGNCILSGLPQQQPKPLLLPGENCCQLLWLVSWVRPPSTTPMYMCKSTMQAFFHMHITPYRQVVQEHQAKSGDSACLHYLSHHAKVKDADLALRSPQQVACTHISNTVESTACILQQRAILHCSKSSPNLNISQFILHKALKQAMSGAMSLHFCSSSTCMKEGKVAGPKSGEKYRPTNGNHNAWPTPPQRVPQDKSGLPPLAVAMQDLSETFTAKQALMSTLHYAQFFWKGVAVAKQHQRAAA